MYVRCVLFHVLPPTSPPPRIFLLYLVYPSHWLNVMKIPLESSTSYGTFHAVVGREITLPMNSMFGSPEVPTELKEFVSEKQKEVTKSGCSAKKTVDNFHTNRKLLSHLLTYTDPFQMPQRRKCNKINKKYTPESLLLVSIRKSKFT